MILSFETLRKFNGPPELISIIKKYQNGIDLFEFCDKNPKLLEKVLFWAENITEVDQLEVDKRLKRINSSNCIASTEIKNSNYIYYSNLIDNSKYIRNCTDLSKCTNCVNTMSSSNCDFNYNSNFNENSFLILIFKTNLLIIKIKYILN